MKNLDRTFCVAPMMDWTDRHCRYFHRLLTRHAVLYTEMVTTGALLHGDVERHLAFDEAEHPVALQLGGSEPDAMAACARMAQEYGYDEVNINVGCPSPRVQRGAFGACLMAEPDLIAGCVKAMQAEVDIPVTIKHRIGIDDQEDYAAMHHFVETVAAAGCQTFIVHARKAWLQGLSPKENRDIPPLRYELVYQLKQAMPELEIIINGGITDLSACQQHLEHVDGVMLGREAYQNPWILQQVDPLFYQTETTYSDPISALQAFVPYVQNQRRQGVWLKHMSRHLLGLFQGRAGAKKWRRLISENAHKTNADSDLLLQAASFIQYEPQD